VFSFLTVQFYARGPSTPTPSGHRITPVFYRVIQVGNPRRHANHINSCRPNAKDGNMTQTINLDRWVTRPDLPALFAEHGMPMSAPTLASRVSRGDGGPPFRINNRRAEYHAATALAWRQSLLRYRGGMPAPKHQETQQPETTTPTRVQRARCGGIGFDGSAVQATPASFTTDGKCRFPSSLTKSNNPRSTPDE
jgi:hypothetical protein